MANITCPQCSRFVDDSAKFCPGCKYNIKKYVKEMKKKGGTVSGSISFGSVYSKTSAGTDVVPELEFLKPQAASPEKPVPQTEVAAAPAYEEPAIQTYEPETVAAAPAAPVYEEPAPAYSVSEPPVVPEYEEPAPAVTENRGVSTVDPRTLFPKDTIPTFRPAYKPRVLASAPAYDPNYKKHEEQAQTAAAYENPAPAAPAPAAPAYEPAAPAAPVYEAPAAPAPAAPVMPAAAVAAPVTPVTPVPVAPVPAAPVPAAPTPAVPPEALLYQQPAAPAAAIPAAAAAAAAIPPEALLYQQPAAPAYQSAQPAYQPAAPVPAYQAPAAAAYQAPAPAYQSAQPAYAQSAAPARPAASYQAARPIQTASAPAAYGQRQQPAPAVTGVFESAALNCGVGGGGAISGEVSGPTILEKLRAEEEEKKANASIFESPNLRAAEKELKNGTRQPAGGLHGEISFDNYIAPERGSFGQATAYQIQQAAYVAAGAAGGSGQSSVPPYAVQQGAGPGGMAYQVPVSSGAPAYAPQAAAPAYAPAPSQAQSVPAFAAGPGMGNPYAPVNGAIPYITQTPAGGANPMLGGGGNPILGGNANPLLGGGT